MYAAARGAFDRRHARYVHHFVVMSLLATSVYYFAFAAGTSLLPSGIAGALSGAIPLFTFLGAAVFLRSEQVTPRRLLGVLIGFGGVLLIARPKIGLALLTLVVVTDLDGITAVAEDRRATIAQEPWRHARDCALTTGGTVSRPHLGISRSR